MCIVWEYIIRYPILKYHILCGQDLIQFRLATEKTTKVGNPYPVTFLTRTPIFEWYVVWCGFKDIYHKGIMCLKDNKLHAQKIITIPGSTVNIIGGEPI